MEKKSYSELSRISSFEDRLLYLKLHGKVGESTFGYDRHFNQSFYSSLEWRHVRNFVILRDNGCDLGLPGYEIHGRIYIHHINPITKDDIVTSSESLLDPENLVCVTFDTHNEIHYGSRSNLSKSTVERFPGDTCPWR